MTFDDLDGAFRSLMDTLQNRYDPFFGKDVGGRWLGAMAAAAVIARNASAWNAVPDPPSAAGPPTAALDGAARALASAAKAGDEAKLAALGTVDSALGTLEAYLADPR